MTKARLMK